MIFTVKTLERYFSPCKRVHNLNLIYSWNVKGSTFREMISNLCHKCQSQAVLACLPLYRKVLQHVARNHQLNDCCQAEGKCGMVFVLLMSTALQASLSFLPRWLFPGCSEWDLAIAGSYFWHGLTVTTFFPEPQACSLLPRYLKSTHLVSWCGCWLLQETLAFSGSVKIQAADKEVWLQRAWL